MFPVLMLEFSVVHSGATSNPKWLEDQCTAACASDKQIVILTHHAPFTAGLVPNVSFGAALLGSGCVGSDLLGTRFTTARFPTLRYWLYGHTHLNKNTTIGGVHTLSNQMGYPQDTWKSWALSSVLPGYTTFQPSLKITLM
ncbi:hypothetical protein Pelo_3312 [Pelomyxa schiedti]|nr:hypothetical protein Pelo_3312 [Pelomyxa schiedti]